MGDVLRIVFCYGVSLAAAWLILGCAKELFIAWYNGAEARIPLSTMVTTGLQILVNLAAIGLALTAV